jgi:hypothetical protein
MLFWILGSSGSMRRLACSTVISQLLKTYYLCMLRIASFADFPDANIIYAKHFDMLVSKSRTKFTCWIVPKRLNSLRITSSVTRRGRPAIYTLQFSAILIPPFSLVSWLKLSRLY